MFDVLRAVVKSKDFSKDNQALTEAIESVRSAYPHMFLQPHELKNRRFYHEPGTNIPFESCTIPIRPLKVLKKVRP